MPIPIESFRNRAEVRRMTDGANALALKPELAPSPLKIVNPEIGSPIQISDFIKRKNIVHNQKEAETEKFIEREIDPDKPWSAFGQVMFIKEHEIDGKKVKKNCRNKYCLSWWSGNKNGWRSLK